MDNVKINRMDPPPASASCEAAASAALKPDNDVGAAPSLEKHLYDSLLRKQKLFKMLVNEGTLERPKGEEIERQIAQALADLEEIAGITG